MGVVLLAVGLLLTAVVLGRVLLWWRHRDDGWPDDDGYPGAHHRKDHAGEHDAGEHDEDEVERESGDGDDPDADDLDGGVGSGRPRHGSTDGHTADEDAVPADDGPGEDEPPGDENLGSGPGDADGAAPLPSPRALDVLPEARGHRSLALRRRDRDAPADRPPSPRRMIIPATLQVPVEEAWQPSEPDPSAAAAGGIPLPRRARLLDPVTPEPAISPEPAVTTPEPAAPEPAVTTPDQAAPLLLSPPGLVVPAGRHEETRPVPAHGRRSPSPTQRKALRAASRRLESLSDRVEIARATAEEGRRLVEADSAALLISSVEGPRVLWQEPGGPNPAAQWGPATLAALLSVGVPVREVVQGDPLSDFGMTALLVVPVPSAGMLAGSILARRASGRSFSPAEEDSLARLARMTGSALEAVARRGATAPEYRDDPVSGFGSRDRLLNDLRVALRSAQTHGMPTSLVLAGVCGLAAARRVHGKVAADEIVGAVASVVAGELRVGDVAYRFSRDEIALLLPGTGPEVAGAVATRLAHAAREVRAPQGPIVLRTAAVPVNGIAEEVVLAAVKALAAGTRAGWGRLRE